MLEMKVLLIVILYLFLGNCIVLRLPLLNEDSENFIIKNKYLLGDYNLIYYESKDDDQLIDKVYYHDVEIYPAESSIPGIAYDEVLANFIIVILNQIHHDNIYALLTEEQRNNIRIEPEHYREFRRIVIVAKLLRIMFITVLTLKWDGERQIKDIERLYKYENGTINYIMDNQEFYMSLQFEENVANSAKIIRNILKREVTKAKSYDELDEVDDEPQLVKGNDISPEQIRKEVTEIMNNHGINDPNLRDADTNELNISEADLRDAGPSGLSFMLRTKLKLNEPRQDSDSE